MGVSDTDTEEITDKMVDKMCKLRIFEDENGKTNCSLADVDGEIPLISQFTLYADCSHGNRPGFTGAGNPELANHLYEHALARCAGQVRKVEHGIFGADMKVELLNDGPFTILLDSDTIVKRNDSQKEEGYVSSERTERKLIWEFPNIGKKAPEQEEKAFAYCEGYKEFLNVAKTEREFVREAVLRPKEAGYEEFEEGKIYQPGDKVYQINRKKALLMSTFGKRPLEDGVRINVAHIDSPRPDLETEPAV